MKSILYCIKRLYSTCFPFIPALKRLLIGTLFFLAIQSQLMAQNNQFIKPSWWYGASGGANFNLYHGSTQVVNSDLTISASFQNTKGQGIFAFPTIEFHRPDSKLGFTLNLGYDNRSGSFDSTFHTKLAYITVEPNIRLNLFNSPFYLFSGPRIAYNVDKRYTYQPDGNSPEQSGVFSDMKEIIYSMQIGGGYDLSLTTKDKKTQVILAPFASFHPYFGQNPRTIEFWNLTTIRAGMSLKFGIGHKKSMPEQVEVPVVIVVEPEDRLIVNDSRNIPIELTGKEGHALQNYVYFNSLASKNVSHADGHGKELEENQRTFSSVANLSDSSFRRMIVKDNIVNMLGVQMAKNPSSSITLIGASKDGVKDGQRMAESIKVFLTDVYGIEDSKITTKSRRKIKIHSEQDGDKKKIALLQERERRVLIKSNSSNLQLEFRGGSNGVPLKPLQMNTVEEANEYNYITFKTEGSNEPFTSWILKITDELGIVKNFGPFTKELASISGKSILGSSNYGKFRIQMIGQLNSGRTLAKDTIAYLSHWAPPVSDNGSRFKILYEYNNLKAIDLYKSYLTDVVAANIPKSSTVVIHGHTENVISKDSNMELILAKVNDTREILESALAKASRTDVRIEVYGFSKDQIIAPFKKDNQLDNQANRTIIIDIIPKK